MDAMFGGKSIKSVGNIVGIEADVPSITAGVGLDFCQIPNINPFKDPLCARGQETPGEDPYNLS